MKLLADLKTLGDGSKIVRLMDAGVAVATVLVTPTRHAGGCTQEQAATMAEVLARFINERGIELVK